ncbi:hypothetical protein [Paenibacillus sp. 1A_MP2]
MSRLVFIEANTTGTGMLALTRAAGWDLTPYFIPIIQIGTPD